MATRVPLVINNGAIQQLQSGDVIISDQAITDVRSLTNGESSAAVVIGMAVYISGAGSYKRAQANAASTSEVIGLAKDTSVAAAAAGYVATGGVLVATTGQWDVVTGDTGGLTAGSVYFLDPSTAGHITKTAPSTVGQLVCRVGKALSTTEMEIIPGNPILL